MNVNYPGNGISLTERLASSVEECRSVYQHEATCVGWRWLNDTGDQKTKMVTNKRRNKWVSGPRDCKG